MKKTICLVIGGLAVFSTELIATQPIFTWIDQSGVTHYSETPPVDDSIESFRIEHEQPPAAGPAPEDDYFSVVNQAERMEKSRLENEKVRTARLRAEAEARRATAASQPRSAYNDYDTNRYYPAYPVYGYQPGYRPGYKPGHRPGRPTQLPEPGHGATHSRPITRAHF